MFLKNLDMSQEYMYNVITKIVSLNNSYFVEDKEQIHSKIQEMFVFKTNYWVIKEILYFDIKIAIFDV